MKSNSSPYRAGRPTPYSFRDGRCIRCQIIYGKKMIKTTHNERAR